MRRLGLALLSTALAVAAADLGLRWLELPAARGPVAWRAHLEPTNSLGFRGPEPRKIKAGPRLLLLGDSQVEAFYLEEYQKALGPQLQRRLGKTATPWEVVAVGASGWGTDQQVLALELLIGQLKPDVVVHFLTPENDIVENLFSTGGGQPKPTFRLDGQRLVPPPPELWPRPLAAQSGYGLLPTLARVLNRHPDDGAWERTLPPRSAAPAASAGLPRLADLFFAAQGRNLLWKSEDLSSEMSRFAPLRQPPTPRMRYAMSLLGALLRRMRDQCRAQGVPLYVIKQHDPADRRLFDGQLVAHHGRAYRLAVAPTEARIRRMLEDLELPLLDVALNHREHTFLPRDFHLNGAGYARVPEATAAWLQRRPGFRAAALHRRGVGPRTKSSTPSRR